MRIFIAIVICHSFLLFFSDSPLCAGTSPVIESINSQGVWEKGIITNRNCIFTATAGALSSIEAYVSSPGKYQLFAYIYHNWRDREVFPCIYTEAIDSTGKKHAGSHMIENIWYLNEKKRGRWFFIALSDNPYWTLPKGKLQIKFWVKGKRSPWENEIIPMENNIAIESFFILPVLGSNSESVSLGIIHPESGRGNWGVIHYHPLHATNLIEAAEKDALFSYTIYVPKSAYYRGWISVLSYQNNQLKLILKGDSKKHEADVRLKSDHNWSLVTTKTLYLQKGSYTLSFRSSSLNKISIDYFLLVPIR